MVKMIKESLEIDVSKELIRVAIVKLGYTKKKARFYGSPSNLEEKTFIFIKQRNEYMNEGRRFLSIDETSFGRNGIESKGYSKIGKPLYIQKLKPRMTTKSSVCCAFSDGSFIRRDIVGSFNCVLFIEFLKELKTKPNDVILLDNVSFHHSKSVLEVLKHKKVDALFVPPYSPWFNPIELCFSIVKRTYYKTQSMDEAYSSLLPSHIKAFFTKSLNTYGHF